MVTYGYIWLYMVIYGYIWMWNFWVIPISSDIGESTKLIYQYPYRSG